jgi:hypothetical protein
LRHTARISQTTGKPSPTPPSPPVDCPRQYISSQRPAFERRGGRSSRFAWISMILHRCFPPRFCLLCCRPRCRRPCGGGCRCSCHYSCFCCYSCCCRHRRLAGGIVRGCSNGCNLVAVGLRAESYHVPLHLVSCCGIPWGEGRVIGHRLWVVTAGLVRTNGCRGGYEGLTEGQEQVPPWPAASSFRPRVPSNFRYEASYQRIFERILPRS